MKARPRARAAAASALVAAALAMPPASPVHGDEGMWTLDNLPLARLKERYGFTPDQDWIDAMRLSAVRFNDGGSGSFVSADGLVLTNHHVALGQLQKVSSEKKDFVKEGFFARTRVEELKCPDLELNVLVSLESVTDRVLAAVNQKDSDKDQNDQRKAEMSRIEKESTDKTGLRSDVVELYQGGEYWLYRYKKYTDIRLVMAPEQQAAFYGGDPDNFTYPRFDLDFAFFRAYEDGKPVKPSHFLPFSRTGARDGELVFVLGHPGHTDRLKTFRQLEHERDFALPTRLKILARRRKAFLDYSARGAEQARRAKDRVFSIENSIKALTGELDGLKDPVLMGRKGESEKELQAFVSKRKDLKFSRGSWKSIAKARDLVEKRHREASYRSFFGSKLAGFATTLVRYGTEVEKPNDKRYEEFRDSALESLRFRLFSPAPIYPDMEEALLADILRESLDELGPKDPHVAAALEGKDPAQAARELVSGTKLADPAARRALAEGGSKAIAASTDPLIVWARRLDPSYRELRKWYEDRVQSVEAVEGNRVARARFALYGRTAYPDATFTLRLSYGKVAGYPLGTTLVPPRTTFHGLFDRALSFESAPPFDLPADVLAARPTIEPTTPLNFVTTNDIIGGNSGSPVINRAGECVGVIFDGNIQSLVWSYAYSDEQARAVAVHSRAILEALRAIYPMPELSAELLHEPL